MGKMLLTKEEKQEIKKSLGFVLDDIRELWKLSQTEIIDINLPKMFNPYAITSLVITENRVTLEECGYDDVWRYHLERPGIPKPNRTPSNYEYALTFVSNYEEIRPKIEEQIKAGLDKKGLSIERLKEINMKYDKYASIEIDLPPANNQYPLEVTEENGQKIGILNFGDRTIKLITNGDIVLVDKTKPVLAKVKRK